LLQQAISFGACYVDVEIESGAAFISALKECAVKHRCGLIVSYHNFEKTPDLPELSAIVEQCHAHCIKSNIVKIACMVNSERDILNIKSLYSKKYPIIALGMGEKGVITRIKACEWGAPFTYAAADVNNATALGQMGYEE
jgi:3-dehydroquinate dehydratase-1